jgi:hypothetical protein
VAKGQSTQIIKENNSKKPNEGISKIIHLSERELQKSKVLKYLSRG